MSAENDLLDRDRIHKAAARLHKEFVGTFGAETIESVLADSMTRLAEGAQVGAFVPLLAERFTRERLHAVAKAENKAVDSNPTVLFICVHNAGRSQMAAGWLQHLAGDQVDVLSAGSNPAEGINPTTVRAMEEVGIDIGEQYPKPWTSETLGAADFVVTMGCGDACPVIPGKRYLDWELDDPAGKSLDDVRPIRDEIEARIRGLLDEILSGPVERRPSNPA